MRVKRGSGVRPGRGQLAALVVVMIGLAFRPGAASPAAWGQQEPPPNVLLILVDDLKPALGCYGDPVARTPHLDRLAARSLRFEHAYCNQAVCAPSRFTLMLGSHSTSTGLYGLGNRLREAYPDAVTLPQYFARHGYRTESLGKVFHIGHGNLGDPESFSVPHFHEKVIEYADPASTGGQLTREEAYFTNQKLGQIGSLPRGAAYESPEVPDQAYADGRVAEETVKRLQAAAQRRRDTGTPFLIAAGFARPHLPFSAPKKYWDLYDPSTLPMPAFEDLPAGAPAVAGKRGGEITNYAPVPEGRQAPFDPQLKQNLIHGYYASTSYVDAQIGKVLAELDRLELFENTIVVVWGDHGFHLGDLGIWTKHTNYEQANRIPLLVHAPGVTGAGTVARQLAQTVDLFPTLAELAGLPAPEVPQPLDGLSLVPSLKDPRREVRDHVYHAYPKQKMGRAVRTQRYRLVEWKPIGGDPAEAEWELYDYQTDPLEQRNLAGERPDVVQRLQEILATYPPPHPRGGRPAGQRKAARPPARSVAPGMSPASVRPSKRPDMVVFLSDDHTWRDSSVYGLPEYPTPNMARLAANGMTFTQAYVASPSCAPSRAALLTGMYPARNGAEPNHSRPLPDLKKLPAYLQDLGYEVVSFGKVGHYRQTAEYGFDLARHFNYHEDEAVSEAIAWLKQRDSDKPLCLFVGTNWPHVPWPEEAEGIDPQTLTIPPNHVDHPVSRQWRARYLAAIRQMDRELGAVYDAAREVLGEDVFFLHTSDHGAQWPFAKWNLYDDGTHTPLIVSWPGHIEAGSQSSALVSWIDILPTLVEVAESGRPQPSSQRDSSALQKIDGRSFLEVLQGKADSHRDLIFTTHSGDGDFNVFPSRSVRTADGWRYIRNLHPEFRVTSHTTSQRPDGGYWDSWLDAAGTSPAAQALVRKYHRRPAEELYQLQQDPWEQHNLVDQSQHRERLAALRQQLDQWLAATGDRQQVFGRPRVRAGQAPNIVTVFIDDMGYSDLSCFGGQRAKTENIDALAAEGLRFTQFYVNSPICSPSRTALTTGQYPYRWRISSYLNHRQSNRDRGMAQWLDPRAPVLARELNHAGYATGHFGKWHMGGQRDVGDAPYITAYGFDRTLTNFEGLGPRVLGYKDAYDGKPAKPHQLGSHTLGKGPIEYQDRSTITARFVEEAIQFIDHAEVTGQPFFVNVWPDDVHSPFFPPQVLREATDGSKRELYFAVLEAMDRQLGPLFDRIRQNPRLRDNTLILVCSDNGPEDGAGLADPLRGAKTWLYEGGIRSPLIVWGPGLLPAEAAGTTNRTAVFSALDLNRALYTISGTALPEGATLDGEDVSAAVLGRSTAGRQGPLFFRRPPDRPGFGHGYQEDNPDLAMRAGPWKLLVNYDRSQPQLYDLETDPGETRNLAEDQPQRVAQMLEQLFQWNAQMPRDAGDPAYQPDQLRGAGNGRGRQQVPAGK